MGPNLIGMEYVASTRPMGVAIDTPAPIEILVVFRSEFQLDDGKPVKVPELVNAKARAPATPGRGNENAASAV
jgi:hypothetical protein